MYQVAIGWRWGIDSPLVRPPRWIWADCNGGENGEKNNSKNEGIWHKTMGKNGKGGENDEKNNGKKEGLWHKTMEKNGKAMENLSTPSEVDLGRLQWGENDERIWHKTMGKNRKGGKNDEKNNGKKEGLWHKTMEKNGKAMENLSTPSELGKLIKTRGQNGGKNRERVKWGNDVGPKWCQVKEE